MLSTPQPASRPKTRRTPRRALGVASLLVACTLGLSACSSSPSDEPAATTPAVAATTSAPTTTASTPAAATAAPTTAPAPTADVVLTFTISAGKASPAFSQVKVTPGQTVSITVTSDEPDELHVHGYNQEVELAAGTPATVTFTADQTGQFEVETHESGLRLAALVVR